VFLAMAASSRAQPGGSACDAPPLPITGARIVQMSTEPQLQSAVANAQAGDTIVLTDGTYVLASTLYLNGRHSVSIRGTDGCDDVVLVGKRMDNSSYGNVPFGVWSNSLADAGINLRDGASAAQSGNLLTATGDMFVNPAAGDLHLLSTATAAMTSVKVSAAAAGSMAVTALIPTADGAASGPRAPG
jgi:hypothetical protein